MFKKKEGLCPISGFSAPPDEPPSDPLALPPRTQCQIPASAGTIPPLAYDSSAIHLRGRLERGRCRKMSENARNLHNLSTEFPHSFLTPSSLFFLR